MSARGKQIMMAISSMIIIFFLLSILNKDFLITKLGNQIEAFGFWWLFFISFLLELIPQYVAPQLFAFNAAILNFSFAPTVTSLYLGSALGSIIGFEIGNKYKTHLSRTFFSDQLVEKIKNKINSKWGKTYLFISAICPIPFIPFIFGILHLKRINFLILGVLPRFFYFLYVGIVAFYLF